MKTIAVSQQFLFNKHNTLQETMDATWGKLLDTLNFSPIYLPAYYNLEKLHFSGVILTGGGDLYEVSGKQEDKIRDKFEFSLIKFCIEKNIPVFGVCRGMQLINRYFGGTLKKIKNHVGCVHVLSDGREVNSYHNYGINKMGEGIAIIETYEGVIESIRHNSYKIYGEMNHPERHNPFFQRDICLLKDFFYAE
jgi:putative glutamine amidotransferase